MKVLLIGYGSIGKRHYEVLSQMGCIAQIDVVTSQSLSNITTYPTLDAVKDLEHYGYFVIASETFKHFDQIAYLERNTKNAIILCEKPLFDTSKTINVRQNSVYIGYVLRFHPILQKIESILKQEKPFAVQVRCGSYLPFWRPGTDYRKSYSAFKDQGGGVLLDLSHEIDYIQWLFGTIITIDSYQSKISDLEISSDDYVSAIGTTENGTIIDFSLDYISKIPIREILFHTPNITVRADLISNRLEIGTKNGDIETVPTEAPERNDLFRKMHLSALGNREYLSTLEEGLSVMKTISIIQEQANG